MDMRRFLGIDHGSRRIGLAIGDAATRVASPLGTVRAAASLADTVTNVLAAVKPYEFDEFVVGLPLNMDGTDGPQSAAVRRFVEELERQSRHPVRLCDERLSSRAADELLDSGDLGRDAKKQRRDRVAAQVLLQDFLDALPK